MKHYSFTLSDSMPLAVTTEQP